LFIFKKIWEIKHITSEDTKVEKLEITLRDHTLDWYMVLSTNNRTRVPTAISEVKRKLINEF
jgi:hypothetical protein